MAVKDNAPTSIDNFLGLNMSKSGATQIALGESPEMYNFRITKDYKLEKVNGYDSIFSLTSVTKDVRYMGKHKLGATEYFIVVVNGKIYDINPTVPVEIGTITDAVTSVFEFNNKIYFLNGTDYKSYNGTTYEDVVGYIPTIVTAKNPLDSTKTVLEQINILSNKVIEKFSGDGTTVAYKLEYNGTSIVEIKVNGTATTAYTYSSGTVTFTTAPSDLENNVEITYTLYDLDKTGVTNNKYVFLYGLSNNTRVFMYGNSSAKNRIIYSDLNTFGVPDVTYFPSNNFLDIGSNTYPITDMNRQYDRIIISKENETYYAYYESITDADGNTIITFTTYPLNNSHGMIAYNQGQVLNNYVTTIDTSIVSWVNTDTKDERNAQVLSMKVEEWLRDKDLSKAITCDYQYLNEYWLAIDKDILVYNYSIGVFYIYKFNDNVRSLYVDNDIVYIGTDKAQVFEFKDLYSSYNGTAIESIWKSGYIDFGAEYLRKTMRTLWITAKPYPHSSLEISYASDRDTAYESKYIESSYLDFGYIDFGNFTFNVNYKLRPFRIKMKAKKFTYIQIILENNELQDKIIVNSIAIKKEYGSYSK